MARNNQIDLVIEDMAAGGRGLAFHNRQSVFVPYTIPGERVRVRILETTERYSTAEGIELLDASADRVYPGCRHFGPGRCGRCQWQHIAYEAQALLKQDVLAEHLSRVAGLTDREIERALRPIIASPQEWGYNHHITFNVTEDGKLGLPSTEEGRIIAIEECPITHPDVVGLMEQLDLELTGIRRVRLEMGSDDALMIVLWLVGEGDAPELEAELPASVNVLLPDNEPMNLIGDTHTRYEVNGRWFRATAGSYFRPNVAGVGLLAQAVNHLVAAKSTDAILDLYAGVGVFGAFAAETASLVTLVESYPPTATDADENLADYEHVDVIEGGVDAVLPELDDHYDAMIIDPPSVGLSDATARLIGDHAPDRIVYVSGDPASLARDVKRLKKVGYRLTVAQPIDLAPQTYYQETIARFER